MAFEGPLAGFYGGAGAEQDLATGALNQQLLRGQIAAQPTALELQKQQIADYQALAKYRQVETEAKQLDIARTRKFMEIMGGGGAAPAAPGAVPPGAPETAGAMPPGVPGQAGVPGAAGPVQTMNAMATPPKEGVVNPNAGDPFVSLDALSKGMSARMMRDVQLADRLQGGGFVTEAGELYKNADRTYGELVKREEAVHKSRKEDLESAQKVQKILTDAAVTAKPGDLRSIQNARAMISTLAGDDPRVKDILALPDSQFVPIINQLATNSTEAVKNLKDRAEANNANSNAALASSRRVLENLKVDRERQAKTDYDAYKDQTLKSGGTPKGFTEWTEGLKHPGRQGETATQERMNKILAQDVGTGLFRSSELFKGVKPGQVPAGSILLTNEKKIDGIIDASAAYLERKETPPNLQKNDALLLGIAFDLASARQGGGKPTNVQIKELLKTMPIAGDTEETKQEKWRIIFNGLDEANSGLPEFRQKDAKKYFGDNYEKIMGSVGMPGFEAPRPTAAPAAKPAAATGVDMSNPLLK